MSIKDQARLILAELESVMNLNYNLEHVYLNAIERGLQKIKETPATAIARDQSNQKI